MAFELSPDEHSFLAALLKHDVKFIIVGLSSAVLQGAHVVTQDIDLWVNNLGSEAFLAAVSSVNGFYVPPGLVGGNAPMLGPQSLRIFDLVTNMHGLGDFETEYQRCGVVEVKGLSLRILPLERIIISKESANRDKDRAVLPALRASLIASIAQRK